MTLDNFFTIFKNYIKSCWCSSDGCCIVEKERGGDGIGIGIGIGDGSPYSIDNFSNSDTPMTKSSSDSSIDSIYKRPNFRPYISIIPANYYTE